MDTRSSWAIVSLWITAIGVIFAGSQLFVMAISASLEGVSHWPYISLEYALRTDDDGSKHTDIEVVNSGAGLAVIRSVSISRGNTQYTTFDAAIDEMYAKSGQPRPEGKRVNSISYRVLPPGVDSLPLYRLSGDQRVIIRSKLLNPSITKFEICYCSTMEMSWVGHVASWMAQVPYCWIAHRDAFGPRVDKINGICPENSFIN